MPSVQSSYPLTQAQALVGQIAGGSPNRIDSYELSGTEDVNFGTMVFQNTGAGLDKVCHQSPSTKTIAGNTFLGVAIKNPAVLPDASDSDHYSAGDIISVLVEGDIWVETTTATVAGDDVYCVFASGEFGNGTVGTTEIDVTDARWMSTAAANGIARLRLTGIQPSS